jgi:hypothetical protein
MVHSPQHYGIPTTSTGHTQPSLAYDSYVEQARTRAVAEKSLAFQQMQTALLGSMAGTLRDISSEMSQIRRLHEEGLAVQQELLKREVIQQQLEELIFQADKLVAECSNPRTDVPPSSRYFLLQGFLQTVEQQGIGTAIIKGRDNKAAFERVVQVAGKLRAALTTDPDVKAALAWAAQLEQQRADQRQQLEDKMRPYRQQLATLQAKRNGVTLGEVWAKWKDQAAEWVDPQLRTPVLVAVCLVGFCLFPFVPIVAVFTLVGLLIDKVRLTQKQNAEIDAQIAKIEMKLQALETRLEKV